MIKNKTELLDKIINGYQLNIVESENLITSITNGEFNGIYLSALLVGLQNNHMNYQLIAGFSNVLANRVKPIRYYGDNPMIDIVGTGGALFKSFNVSTVSSIVSPLLGITVAKHGNRSSTSKSGSADLLEALGVNIEMSDMVAERCLNKLGITFMYAPIYHPATKSVSAIRKELKIKTIFNIIGPLTNPASVRRQLTGVYSSKLQEPVIKAMQKRSYERAAVVFNDIGADEICPFGTNRILELNNNKIKEYYVTADDFGLDKCKPEEIANISPELGVIKTYEILEGKKSPLSDFVIMNTAMAMRIAGVEEDLKVASNRVRDVLESGEALDLINKFVSISKEVELIAEI